MSCLITQSSSDSGSCGPSDASQRTACTLDLKNGSIIRSLLKKRSSQKIIVQYIKRNGEARPPDTPQEEVQILHKENAVLFKPPKSLKRSQSFSEGISFLQNDITNDISNSYRRRWFSCIHINFEEKSAV